MTFYFDENSLTPSKGGSGGGGTGQVDSELSHTSTNPVQNKVITTALSDISASLNMDTYLDLIIAGNTIELPDVVQSNYENDLNNIIGGTYVNV